jgi:hypothetical protein
METINERPVTPRVALPLAYAQLVEVAFWHAADPSVELTWTRARVGGITANRLDGVLTGWTVDIIVGWLDGRPARVKLALAPDGTSEFLRLVSL